MEQLVSSMPPWWAPSCAGRFRRRRRRRDAPLYWSAAATWIPARRRRTPACRCWAWRFLAMPLNRRHSSDIEVNCNNQVIYLFIYLFSSVERERERGAPSSSAYLSLLLMCSRQWSWPLMYRSTPLACIDFNHGAENSFILLTNHNGTTLIEQTIYKLEDDVYDTYEMPCMNTPWGLGEAAARAPGCHRARWRSWWRGGRRRSSMSPWTASAQRPDPGDPDEQTLWTY